MTDPTAHQVENLSAGRYPIAIEIRQPCPEARIEMMHKSRLAVEERVIAGIQLETLGLLENLNNCHASAQCEIPVDNGAELANRAKAREPLDKNGCKKAESSIATRKPQPRRELQKKNARATGKENRPSSAQPKLKGTERKKASRRRRKSWSQESRPAA